MAALCRALRIKIQSVGIGNPVHETDAHRPADGIQHPGGDFAAVFKTGQHHAVFRVIETIGFGETAEDRGRLFTGNGFIGSENAVRRSPGNIGNGITFIITGNRRGIGRNPINERFFTSTRLRPQRSAHGTP